MIYKNLTNKELVNTANILLWGAGIDPLAAELLVRLEDAMDFIHGTEQAILRLQEKYAIPDDEIA